MEPTPHVPSPDPKALEAEVIKVLQGVYDPEIPVNIYDLGLIYKIAIDPTGDVTVRMTLTSPNCPEAESLPPTVESRIKAIPGVASAKAEVVWEPVWTKEMISEAARLQLGL